MVFCFVADAFRDLKLHVALVAWGGRGGGGGEELGGGAIALHGCFAVLRWMQGWRQ